MIKGAELFLKQLVFLMDATALVMAYIVTYFFRQQLGTDIPFYPGTPPVVFEQLKSFDSYAWLLFIIIPLWTAMLHILGAYRELRVKSYLEIMWVLMKTCSLSLLFFGSVVFLLKIDYVSRSFMVFFFATSFCFLSLERAFMIYCWHLMSPRSYFRRSLLIVGTGPRARAFTKIIKTRINDWGLRIVGLVDQDPAMVGREVDDLKIIGTLDELPKILRKRVVDEVLFVVPRGWMTKIEKSILYCESVGVRATVIADLFNIHFAKAHLSELGGLPAITFDPTPADQWQMGIKRFLDTITAFLAILILSPLFLTVALAIKKTSKGPVFFKQKRCGLNGRRFTLYKFRSMVADAAQRRAELQYLNEMTGPVFKAANDPRLTPIGRFIRKTSIDELPQLFNVLLGHMSVVGPRPPIPSEVAKYEPWQRRRLSMRPGITGNWQVSGRNKITDFNVWTELDLEYIDRWSLLFDCKILLKTIPVVLFGIGAK